MIFLHVHTLKYERYSKRNVLALLQIHDATTTNGTLRQLFHIDRLIRTVIAKLQDDCTEDKDVDTRSGPTVPIEVGPRHTWSITT